MDQTILIGDPELVAKKGSKKSPVWTYFGFLPNEKGEPIDLNMAICRFPNCKEKVKLSSANTSNLLRHLRNHHPQEFAKISTGTKSGEHTGKAPHPSSSGQTTLSAFSPYEKSGQKWKKLTDAVTVCIAKDLLPIYSVDKAGFKQLLHTFDPRYTLPGRNYFTKTALPSLYNNLRETIAAELKDTDNYSITMDLWSSRTCEPYLGITCHFIDNDWSMRSRVLETVFTPDDHTAQNLEESLKTCLSEWDLPIEKLAGITTDNGSNIIKMCNDMELPRISCFGHNLHLAINHGMKDDPRVDRMVGLCRNIVSSFSKSWNRRKLLAENQQKEGLPQVSLISVSETSLSVA